MSEAGPTDLTKSRMPADLEREREPSGEVRPVERDVAQVLGQLGGRASAKQLRTRTTKREIGRACADGSVVRVAHGRYALPTLAQGITAAELLGGVVALRSAAVARGWPVKTPPPLPEVALSIPVARSVRSAGPAYACSGRAPRPARRWVV